LIMDDSMHALHAKPDDDFVKDVFSLPEHLRDIIQPYMPQHWAVSHTIRHDNWVWALAFSPNIELLATGSNDNNARIIKTGTGAVSHTIEHGDRVWAVAFSPKGELLATGSADGNARIINIATGEVLHTRW